MSDDDKKPKPPEGDHLTRAEMGIAFGACGSPMALADYERIIEWAARLKKCAELWRGLIAGELALRLDPQTGQIETSPRSQRPATGKAREQEKALAPVDPSLVVPFRDLGAATRSR